MAFRSPDRWRIENKESRPTSEKEVKKGALKGASVTSVRLFTDWTSSEKGKPAARWGHKTTGPGRNIKKH
jgi:hypothetical protein